jgi:hypothetical protein
MAIPRTATLEACERKSAAIVAWLRGPRRRISILVRCLQLIGMMLGRHSLRNAQGPGRNRIAGMRDQIAGERRGLADAVTAGVARQIDMDVVGMEHVGAGRKHG